MRVFHFGLCNFSPKILILAMLFLAAAVAGNAQLPQDGHFNGAVDPLLLDSTTRQYRHNNNRSLSSRTESVSTADNFNLSPTAGEIDPSLSATVDSFPGEVRSLAIQPDGKIILAGYFKTINGNRKINIVRLNADYSIDSTFSAAANATVLSVALQPDGKIVMGGAFTAVNGTNQYRIARLNSDGSIDQTFNAGTGADNIVYDVAVQTDGKILLGGSFNVVNSTTRFNVARLNADGSMDSSFTSPVAPPSPQLLVPGIVYSIALQTDGKILLGGLIVKGVFPTQTTTPVARLNTDGTYDSSFNPGTINSNALKVAVQPDGKILLGGFFSNFNGVTRRYLARLNADGSLDNSFNAGTGPNLPVYSIFVRQNGSILIGGPFSTVDGAARGGAALLNADGSLETAFAPSGSTLGFVYTAVPTLTNQILVGGSFTGIGGSPRDTVAAFNPDGSVDNSINLTSTAFGGVRATAVQPDGKILIGGNFNRVNGSTRRRLARLNADGSTDNSFAATQFSAVQVADVLLQPDGKILVCGTNISANSGSTSASTIVRLNADGSADSTFNQGNIPNARNGTAIALQPDGKILLSYTAVAIGFGPGGGLVRLNADGSVDSSFSAPALQYVAIVVQPDGKIYAGGPFGFGYVNSGTGMSEFHNGILRLNSDGSHDRTFRSAFESTVGTHFTAVYSLALQEDGKLLVGGSLYSQGAVLPTGIARLNASGTLDGAFQTHPISSTSEIARVERLHLLPNGKILAGGRFNNIGTAVANNIVRINSNGILDPAFNSGTDSTVFDITVQSDGRVIIGGDFEIVNGAPRTSVARLLSEPVLQRRSNFDFDGDGKSDVSVFRPADGVWYLNRSSQGFAATQFGITTDKIAPADYDGDGKTDFAVFRDGTWYLLRSQAGFTAVQFGSAGDIPQAADFDGDGRAELAVFRPSSGTWFTLNLFNNQFNGVQFGVSTDKPVVGDYDGDGKADFAVFRPADGTWYLLRSQAGFTGVQFGISTDKTVPADYDGDGKTDLGVYRDGVWYLLRSSQGFGAIQFGVQTDLPAPADFDGDGKADPAVFRDGVWYLLQSTGGFAALQFGAVNDKPVSNAFVQ